MDESSRRYNLRDTRKKPQGVLLKQWEVEYGKLITNQNIRIHTETVKTAIRNAFEDGMFEEWRITLKCPLSGQRIKVPARYAACTHIECFDLEAFLRMKTQKNLLVCPICQKEIQKALANIRIDEYIETVLSTLPDAMKVELFSDGSFTKVHEELVMVPIVIHDDEPYVQNSNALSSDVKQDKFEDDDEPITLSDGEDESMEEIVEIKPISIMPLNIVMKPKTYSSPEPEQFHFGKDENIQGNNDPLAENENLQKKIQELERNLAESQKQLKQLQVQNDLLRIKATEENAPQIQDDNSLATSNLDRQNQQQNGFGESTDESEFGDEVCEYGRESESNDDTLTSKSRALVNKKNNHCERNGSTFQGSSRPKVRPQFKKNAKLPIPRPTLAQSVQLMEKRITNANSAIMSQNTRVTSPCICAGTPAKNRINANFANMQQLKAALSSNILAFIRERNRINAVFVSIRHGLGPI